VSSVAFAGPFGLEMGMSFDEVKNITGNNLILVRDDLYIVDPPNKNDTFGAYYVQISKGYGIVKIQAFSKKITTNGHGTGIKTIFNALLSSIERTYGKYKKVDILMSGSIWDKPEDFMMGLLRDERYLMARWGDEHGSTLPSDIELIDLGTMVMSSDEGYVILEYSSPNQKNVETEKKVVQDSVF
jgi:hypothetical protein